MARRTTPLTKGRTSKRDTAPAQTSEQASPKASRRRRGTEFVDLPAPETSVTDAVLPGGEESAAAVANPSTNEPAKARRGRTTKSQTAPELPRTEDEHPGTTDSSAPDATSVEDHEEVSVDTGTASTPSASPRQNRRGRQEKLDRPSPTKSDAAAAPPTPQSSAARWDAETDTVTFDWPAIEQVAATQGPNQAMARLLLAARAEGANSRWPF